ncbi:toll/interleukin-1 receptor domain-containing protein [Aquincola sp. J276]|uniref:toll/interleukin-1 receptor domain-containing protein n=1 Tax=Aquincola sp. J276 TaxID=2898432 RepID=UPI002150E090|nr:toll/interleukin-1 receptor domain-containing protein [Aquincola sp. J276]MCR5868504.1 toll/interleukin-1 receptor domain-containing protein [Aquincola sp. J276]
MSSEIFVSHAVRDKPLADALVDLLQLGLNMNSERIFCSSLEGLGIPSGANFVDHIKSEIQSPKAVIALISPNYLASQFCLCELGATWAMSHQMFPLLIPPLKYSDVQGVMTALQLTKVNHKDDLNQLRDQLQTVLSSKGAPTARWENKRDKFLNGLPSILDALPQPLLIPAAEHEKVKRDYKDAKATIGELEDHLEQRDALITQLSAAKDKVEVARIKTAHSSTSDTLRTLEKNLAKKLKELPRVVAFLVFKELGQREPIKLDASSAKEFLTEVQSAAEGKLVQIDDEGLCSLVSVHPKIKRIEEAYQPLRKFLDGDVQDLAEAFEDEYDTLLALDNREYWEARLDPRIRPIGD